MVATGPRPGNTPTMVPNKQPRKHMAKFIGVDSLAFISIDGLYRAMGLPGGRDPAQPAFCDACFTGDYPTRLVDKESEKPGRKESMLAANG